MPKQKMVVRAGGHNLLHLSHANTEGVALLPRGFDDTLDAAAEHRSLSIGLNWRVPMVNCYLVIPDLHRRKVVAFVAKSKVRRLLKEDCPTRYPEPELALFVWVDGEDINAMPELLTPAVPHWSTCTDPNRFRKAKP